MPGHTVGARPAAIVVIYHANCPDGFAAAWACYRRFGAGPDVSYIPAAYTDDPISDDIIEGSHVYIVDFSYPRDVMEHYARIARSLDVYDHHLTSRDVLTELGKNGRGEVRAVFDLRRSGAGITWDELAPTHSGGDWVIDYIEDRDLWRWEYPESRAMCAGLDLVPRTFEAYDGLLEPGRRDEVLAAGRVALAVQDQQVQRACRQADVRNWAGLRVAFVNSCLYQSEIGNEVLTGAGSHAHPEAQCSVVWYHCRHGLRLSLRSTDDRADVRKLAERLGGGGHRNAAGVTLGLDALPHLRQTLGVAPWDTAVPTSSSSS